MTPSLPQDSDGQTAGHTDLPWRVKPGTALIEQFENGLWGLIVADCGMTDEGTANAAFIVEVVKNHAQLAADLSAAKARNTELEAALACISTPVDVAKLKARMGEMVSEMARAASLLENAQSSWIPGSDSDIEWDERKMRCLSGLRAALKESSNG